MQFVLDIKKNKYLKVWLFITLFTLIFSLIYEYFSFGVISLNMLLAFLYPLLLGLLPSALLNKDLGRFYNDGILLLLFASILNGIFDIYGTDSYYPKYLIILGIILMIFQLFKKSNK